MIPGEGKRLKQVRVLFEDGTTWCGQASNIEIYADSKHEQRIVAAGPGQLFISQRPVRRVLVGRI